MIKKEILQLTVSQDKEGIFVDLKRNEITSALLIGVLMQLTYKVLKEDE